MLQFLHAADLHLDSAFASLSPQQALARRRECRETLFRLRDYVNQEGIGLVLLAGDLLDSASAFRETGEQLAKALRDMHARVFIAPGNHDCARAGSLWQSMDWPENVTVFLDGRMTAVPVPELGITVYGAAFTAPEQTQSLLTGFSAPADGTVPIGLIHGEIEPSQARYDPLTREEIAASGLAYLALGHIHKRTEPLTFGKTVCVWPGCLEGHGFDELGEKGFYRGTLTPDGSVSVRFVPFALRRYEVLTVDVTGTTPREAVEHALPANTAPHLYRILLTGETEEAGVDTADLQRSLAPRFYALELRDHTRMAEDVWQRAEEDSLRGLFLRELRSRWNSAKTEEERQSITQAARFGLAALDHRDL